MKSLLALLPLLAAVSVGSSCARSNNPLALIDHDPATGFAIYRSGQPEKDSVSQICDAGITVIFALNGKGEDYKADLRAACPDAQIVYNTAQKADSGVDQAFLKEFDRAVQAARVSGTRVMFHCGCGCHRTGRLAAYYRMRYNGWSAEDAIEEMNEIGKHMDQHPTLPGQVRAMEDYIHGRSCGQAPDSCVKPD